jgi:hypothetical protein
MQTKALIMDFTKVKIVTFAPIEDADKIRQALGEAGAGTIGEYNFCSCSSASKGRFTPNSNANPHIGKPNKPEVVEEERIEVICNRSDAKSVISALKKAHPYEEVAVDIYPLLDESQL